MHLCTFLLLPAFLLAALTTPLSVSAEIEWSLKKQLKLDAAPVDVTASTDGKWIYVLTPGEILVYAAAVDKVVNRIPLEKGYDRISFSPAGSTLLATSSDGKSLKLIQLDEVHRFSREGAPFKGARDAPVVLAVFTDYQ